MYQGILTHYVYGKLLGISFIGLRLSLDIFRKSQEASAIHFDHNLLNFSLLKEMKDPRYYSISLILNLILSISVAQA